MSIRHVIRLENVPNLKEETSITINIPANAGASFPVELNFPSNVLVNPELMSASLNPRSVQVSSPSISTPPPQLSESTPRFDTPSSPFTLLDKERAPSIREVSNKSPISPGLTALRSDITQQFLPSISSGITATPNPSAISRTSLSSFPTTVSGKSTQAGLGPIIPTGAELATEFLSSPRVISSTRPVTVPDVPASLNTSPPVSPQLSSGTPFRKDLSGILTSPEMMSPEKFNPSSNTPSTRTVSMMSTTGPRISPEAFALLSEEISEVSEREGIRHTTLSLEEAAGNTWNKMSTSEQEQLEKDAADANMEGSSEESEGSDEEMDRGSTPSCSISRQVRFMAGGQTTSLKVERLTPDEFLRKLATM